MMRDITIEAMCRTMRPDFAEERASALPFARGMTDDERASLRAALAEIYDTYIVDAIADEREACARVAETHGVENMKVKFIAADIRARSEIEA